MTSFLPNKLGYEVLTPTGFQPFSGIANMGNKPVLILEFGNRKHLECTPGHRLFRADGKVVLASDLRIGDWVVTQNGRRTRVKSVRDTGRYATVFDLVEVANGHRYFTNDILSHNCSFLSSDETLINPLTLAHLTAKQPIFYTGTIRWFAEPQPNRGYLVALDPSLGTGGDHSAIQIFQLPEMIQVGEWQHNRTVARGQVQTLLRALLFIDGTLRDHPEQHGDPEIFWTVENNTIGETVLQIIEDTGEERFPGTFVSERRRKGQTRRFRKGMTTTNARKLSACARLKSLIESGRMTVHSTNLIREFKNFVSNETTFKAKPGEHDDLVCATLLTVRMLDVVLFWGSNAGDLREYITDDELMDEPMPVIV
jgi:hypothetical protein